MVLAHLLATLVLIGPPAGGQTASPAPERLTTQTATGVDKVFLERCRRAATYSEANNGLAVLVMKSGAVVFEQYGRGHGPDRSANLASGTKSFSGVMAAAAAQDGLLTLDERVSDTIVEWKSDEQKSQITIRQLLSLVSGIEGGTIGRPPSYREALATDCSATPGTTFQYGPAPFQVFGELLRRKLAARDGEPRESVEAYLHRRVLDPIGLQTGFWQRDRDGNINLPSGANLTAREWAKFGEFMRLGGKWGDVQVIDSSLLRECLKPAAANPRYGLTFWLNTPDGTALADPEAGLRPLRRLLPRRDKKHTSFPPDAFMAAGLGKQRLYVIPSLELVIVRQGKLERRATFEDEPFLSTLLGL